MSGTNSRAVSREYKDRLFKFIFGNPEKKEWTLSLYNAVNGSNYTNAEDISLTTVESAVYMNMKNDVSFLVDNIMSFYEQQSTFNPNMPMRFLIYAGMVYSKYIEVNEDYFEYSTRQQRAPAPRCVCFYNGESEKDDVLTLKLSDAFAEDSKPDIEVFVKMININYGKNAQLMEACRPLAEYSWFVGRVRELRKLGRELETAVDAAISELDENSLIRPFLISNKAEVKRMCITEYNEEKHDRQLIAEARAEARAEGEAKGRAEGEAKGRAEGEAKGRVEGIIEILSNLVKDGIMSIEDAALKAHMSITEFQAKAAELNV